ncbi:hypothetical protein [Nocardia stercoris]|uniref:Secreted protein n=1 Tax=Nocardia stercoris TaxID=2483361 RepID=A0A3M2LB83_9NOCA|nr:hypothetical protein [Nocardia stercoris]RMI34832.1 hypothetical protein EBN03_00115 [Nocardia stercoris]
MTSRVRTGTVFAGAVLAAATVSAFTPAANADSFAVDPASYLVGDTVYFTAPNLGNCAMRPNGYVGCDIVGVPMNWYGFQVNNIGIDLPFLPPHPAVGPLGTHGQDSQVLAPGQPGPGQAYGPDASISYGGSTCVVSGFRGEVSCSSGQHNFSFGFTTGYN